MRISPFKVDTIAPVLTEISPIDPENNYSYTFHINENGMVHYGGSCNVKLAEERCM
jgi:hypothetical protein